MANHSSSKKAIRQSHRRTLINQNRKSRIKTYIKKVVQAIESRSSEDARLALTKAQSEMMRGVTKGVMKLSTASRKLSRLSQKVKSLSVPL